MGQRGTQWAGYLGGAAAGVGIGSMIAGDRSATGMEDFSTSMLGAGLGLALTPILGPLAPLVSGVLGGVGDNLFGTSPREYSDTPPYLRGNITSEGISASMRRDWVEAGGIFANSNSGTDYTAMTPELTRNFNQFIQAASNTFTALSVAADESIQSLGGWNMTFSEYLQNEADVLKIQVKIAQNMADHLIPELDSFKLEGEALTDTAIRLTSVFRVTKNIADVMGKAVETAFGDVGFSSVSARNELVNFMGGFEAASNSLGSYYEQFFSDSEKHERGLRNVTEAMTALGVTEEWLPTTRAEFRALVEDQDLTTESGRRMSGALISLSAAFAETSKSMDSLHDSLVKFKESINEGQTGSSSSIQTYDKAKRELASVGRAAALGDSTALDDLQSVVSTFLAAGKTVSRSRLDELRNLAFANIELDRAIATTARHSIPTFASGGQHLGGARIVGEMGPELEITGPSRIVNSRDTSNLVDLTPLIAEVRQLRSDSKAANIAIARNTRRVAQMVRKWDGDGLPEERIA